MKTKKQPKEKEFDSVKTFRAIKEKIAHDIADMDLTSSASVRPSAALADTRAGQATL